MKCEETAEFVSALCDGHQIPRDAAQHIGQCGPCRARLQKYIAMGVEMRREASLQTQDVADSPHWKSEPQVAPHWWEKGWESMRIPKFAFALLLTVIILLGSGLVVVKARQRTQGSVLMLKIKLPNGDINRCALPAGNGDLGYCFLMNLVRQDEISGEVGFGQLYSSFRVIANDGVRFQIGARVKFIASSPIGKGKTYELLVSSLDDVPEDSYWFVPGEKLEIDVPHMGKMELTGEALDHMPSIVTSETSGEEPLDPKEGQFRVVSPVLFKGSERVLDMEGFTSVSSGNQPVYLFSPGTGRFVLSPAPMAGAVEGEIRQSRIFFKIGSDSYQILAAVPISRSQRVWVVYDPDYKPSRELPGQPDDQPSAGTTAMDQHLSEKK